MFEVGIVRARNLDGITHLPAKRRRNALKVFSAAMAIMGLHAGFAPAATNYVWSTTAATGNMATPGNWVGGSVPASGTTNTWEFGNSAATALSDYLTTGTFDVGGITFDAGDPAYTINRGNATDGVIILTGTVANNSANLQIFNDQITLNAAHTFSMTTGGGNITLGGNISGVGPINTAGAGTLTLLGTVTTTSTTAVATSTTLQIGNGTNGSISGAVSTAATGTAAFDLATGGTYAGNISNAGTVAGTEGGGITNTFSGVISSTGAFNQTGSGTTILSGNNTFSGATTISAGTLQLNSTLAMQKSTITLGAANDLTFGTGIGNFTLGGLASTSYNLTLGDTGNNPITLSVGNNSASTAFGGVLSDPAGGSGNFTKIGTGTLTLTGNNTYSGTTTISAGILQFGSATTSGALAASGTIIDNATLTINRANAATQGTDFSGSAITGIGNFTQAGTGTTTLTAADSFSGNTTVSAGILDLMNTLALQNSTLNVTTGTVTFDPSVGGNFTLGGLTGSGGLTLNDGANAVTLSVGNNNNSPSSYTGSLTGNGTLIKIGTGNLTLGGSTNTYSGGLTINSGLVIAQNDSIGNGTVTLGNSSGSANAALEAAKNNATISNAITVAGGSSGVLTLESTETGTAGGYTGNITLSNNLTMAQLTAGATLNFSGNITGAGNLTIGLTNIGTVAIGGVANFTGNTTIGNSTMQIGGGATAGNLSGNNNITDNATLSFKRSNALLQGSDFGVISGTGNVTQAGTGTTTLNATNAYGGNTTLTAGELSVSSSANFGNATANLVFNGGTLQITGSALTNFSGIGHPVVFNNNTSAGLDINSAANTFTVDQALNLGTGSFSKLGLGTVILSLANSYTGATTISAGTLLISGPGTLGSGGVTMSGGTLDLGNTSQTVGAVSITTAVTGGNAIQNGNLTGTSFAASNTTGNAMITANLLGAGGLTKSGAGNLTLLGANTYTGTTTLNAGEVNLGVTEIAGTSGPLGNSAANNPGSIVFGGGYLQYSSVNQNDYSGRFSTAANQQYKADTNGQNVTWATALISSGGALTKIGNGTLTLTGNNTYTGTTTLNGGGLAIANAAGSATGSGNVTITSGILGGNGTMIPTATAGTLIAIAAGAQLSPSFGAGNTTTTLNANVSSSASAAAFNIAGGAILNFNFAAPGTGDTLSVTGNVTLAAGNDTLNINQLAGFGVGAYTLLSATSLTDSVGNWTLPSSPTYAYAVVGNGTALMLDVTPSGPVTVTWNGNISGSWDTVTPNWQGSALYADNDTVVFDDAATGPNFTVDLGGGTVNPGNVTVNNSSNAYSIGNGTIGGNASLVKNGTNKLTLTGNNTFAGGTIVNAGALDVATMTNGLLSGSSVANYAALQFDGAQALGTITGNGTTTVSGTGVLAVTSFAQSNLVNNGAFTLNGAGTIGRAISGSGNLTVSSTGVLTVAAFAQTALVNNGAAYINGNSTIGQLTGGGNLTIGTGSSNNTVQLIQTALPNSFIHTQQAVTISSGSTLDITNNTLLLNYGSGSTPLAAVQTAVANGSLTSSTISTGGSGQFAVGYADNTELGSVPAGNVEVMFTLGGDANLDGVVNFNDYSILQNHYNQTGCDWAQGDFNNDGSVNFNDYSILQNNYGQTLAGVVSGSSIIAKHLAQASRSGTIVGAALAASGLTEITSSITPATAPTITYSLSVNEDGIGDDSVGLHATDIAVVPEPASMSLLLLGGAPLLSRRRRRQA